MIFHASQFPTVDCHLLQYLMLDLMPVPFAILHQALAQF
jgi:hypothetical protein